MNRLMVPVKCICSRLIVIVLIQIALISTDDWTENYINVCNFDSAPDILENLEKLVQFERSKRDDFSDYSVQYHFVRNRCKQIISNSDQHQFDSAPTQLSAFLSNDDNYIFLYISIESYIKTIVGNQTKRYEMDFWSLRTLFNPQNQIFVLLIKEVSVPVEVTPRVYNIEYNFENNQNLFNSTKTSDLRKSAASEDELILKDFKINLDREFLNISLVENSELIGYSINNSYLILCGQKKKSFGKNSMVKCWPTEAKKEIVCECESVGNQTIIYMMFIFWCIYLIIVTKPILEQTLPDQHRKEKVVYVQLINCNERNVRYRYVIGIRLAKTSIDYNLDDITLDVEFLTERNESVAPALRIDAKVLQSRPLVDIRIYMWRLTDLPPLKKIKCHHSGGPDLKIVLLGVFSSCVKGGKGGSTANQTKWFKIYKHIVKTERHFNLREYTDDEEVEDAEDKHLSALTLSQIRLTFLELVWILFVNTSLICLVSALTIKLVKSELAQLLVSILISASAAIVFNVMFIKLHEIIVFYGIRQKTKLQSKSETFSLNAITMYYIVWIVAAFGCGIWVCVLKYYDSDSDTLRWLTSSFAASALFSFVSVIISHLPFNRTKLPSETEKTITSASIKSNYSE